MRNNNFRYEDGNYISNIPPQAQTMSVGCLDISPETRRNIEEQAPRACVFGTVSLVSFFVSNLCLPACISVPISAFLGYKTVKHIDEQIAQSRSNIPTFLPPPVHTFEVKQQNSQLMASVAGGSQLEVSAFIEPNYRPTLESFSDYKPHLLDQSTLGRSNLAYSALGNSVLGQSIYQDPSSQISSPSATPYGGYQPPVFSSKPPAQFSR